MPDSNLTRFWAKVERRLDDECWIWTGATFTNGYGAFKAPGGMMLAHRFSFMQHGGELVPEMVVMHSCDVKLCVNPAHLSLGSQRDNMLDALQKGRVRGGPSVRGTRAKFAAEQVVEARELYAAGTNITQLAARYGVRRRTIASIIQGKSWKLIGGPIASEPGKPGRVPVRPY